MERNRVQRWVADYERLWRSPGTAALAELFTEDADYVPSPWVPPVGGLPAIARFWDAERDGPDEEFEMSSQLVAVDGRTAVVRVSVTYGGPGGGSWRDLWVLELAEDGRCSRFEEWPFAPEQPDGHAPPA
jgi:ketosteroid isomerase-like protein